MQQATFYIFILLKKPIKLDISCELSAGDMINIAGMSHNLSSAAVMVGLVQLY